MASPYFNDSRDPGADLLDGVYAVESRRVFTTPTSYPVQFLSADPAAHRGSDEYGTGMQQISTTSSFDQQTQMRTTSATSDSARSGPGSALGLTHESAPNIRQTVYQTLLHIEPALLDAGIEECVKVEGDTDSEPLSYDSVDSKSTLEISVGGKPHISRLCPTEKQAGRLYAADTPEIPREAHLRFTRWLEERMKAMATERDLEERRKKLRELERGDMRETEKEFAGDGDIEGENKLTANADWVVMPEAVLEVHRV